MRLRMYIYYSLAYLLALLQRLQMRLGLRRLWVRTTAWDPVRCPGCGWAGPLRWAFHTYRASGDDDVEACDECPECGCDELDYDF